jgi:hypothetical protein
LHTHRPNTVQWEFLSILIHWRLSKQRKWNVFFESIRDWWVVVESVHGHQWKTVVAVVVKGGDMIVVGSNLTESNWRNIYFDKNKRFNSYQDLLNNSNHRLEKNPLDKYKYYLNIEHLLYDNFDLLDIVHLINFYNDLMV